MFQSKRSKDEAKKREAMIASLRKGLPAEYLERERKMKHESKLLEENL